MRPGSSEGRLDRIAIAAADNTTVGITDLYAGAGGIGYQRAILSALIQPTRAA